MIAAFCAASAPEYTKYLALKSLDWLESVLSYVLLGNGSLMYLMVVATLLRLHVMLRTMRPL